MLQSGLILDATATAQRWVGKPSRRWIAFICSFVVSVWLFASLSQSKISFFKPPPILRPPSSSHIWSARAAEVRDAFRHAYSGYQKYASSYDELLPVTGGKANKCTFSLYYFNTAVFETLNCRWNGWSVTVVDALDTMWIMDLQDDFRDAIPVVANTSFISSSDVGIHNSLHFQTSAKIPDQSRLSLRTFLRQ